MERNMIYISGQVHCKLQGVCYIVSKRHELWSTNGFKLDHSFYPSPVNSAFHMVDPSSDPSTSLPRVSGFSSCYLD